MDSRMDISFTSYICIFPFLLFLIQTICQSYNQDKKLYEFIQLYCCILSFLATADLELYSAWGYRMDATPLQYFKSPKEMGASISSSPLLLLLLIFIVLSATFLFGFIKNILNSILFIIRPIKFSIFRVIISLISCSSFFLSQYAVEFKKFLLIKAMFIFLEKLFADHAALEFTMEFNVFHSQ